MRRNLLLLVFTILAMAGMSQETIWNMNQVVSPVVNNDNTVTFSFFAPDARKVEVGGDFLSPIQIETPIGKMEQPGTAMLTKNENGVWTFTSEQLNSELYSYYFIVDGIRILDPANVYVNRDIATLTNIFIIPGDKGDIYKVNEVPHGDVAKVWYDSPTLKMKRRMTVYTPAGYDSGKDYPVMYLLHGAGGDEDAWTTLGRASQIMDNLIAVGKAKPMIVVMTNGNVDSQAAPGEWSRGMYTPSFLGSVNFASKPAATMDESFKDVINYVESHYKVAKNKKSRAVCGLSMGGGHSFAISKHYPDMFDYIGLFSAGLHIGQDSQNTTFYDALKANEKTQAELKALFAANPKLYWIAIGNTDFLYQQNADLRRYFDENKYPYTYVETEGGHIWRNWRIYLTMFSQLIF